MTTADYALIISLCSAVISLLSFGWNVWSKFIFPKPRLQVTFSLMQAVDLTAGKLEDRAIRISVTNHGPIVAKVTGVQLRLKKKRIFGRPRYAIPKLLVRPFYSETTDFHAGLPRTVNIGDSLDLYMPYAPKSALQRGVVGIGITDGFSRSH